jgi:hypothetical protein
MAQTIPRILTVNSEFITASHDLEFKTIQEAINSITGSAVHVIKLRDSVTESPKLVLPLNGLNIIIEGHGQFGITFAAGEDTCTLGTNKKLCFSNMTDVVGGKIDLNEGGAGVIFKNCHNVVGSITCEQFCSTSTGLYGTKLTAPQGYPGITVRGANAVIDIESSSVKGARDYPAIDFFISSDKMIKIKKSAIMSGVGYGYPFRCNNGVKVGLHAYNCSSNGTICHMRDMTNYIVANNNIIDAEITF